MALTERQIYNLNNMNSAAQDVMLGDLLNGSSGEEGSSFVKGAAVANATGESVTADEFNALLTSLRNAGIIAG
jgi:hypothetical protein